MKATRRFSSGLNVIASYAWSKFLDDTSGIRNQGNDELYPQNSEHWVNKAAYAPGNPGFYGTVQRASFTGPGVTNLDASLHKDFAMPYKESHVLSIRFEAFNSLNHPNWGTPNMTYTSPTFGRITGTNTTVPMRQLQLAAKYVF